MAKPPSLLHHLITLDTKISHFLHSLFHSFLPTSLLLVLELSADFRFSFPVCLAFFFSPLCSPSLLPLFVPLLLGLLVDLAFIGLIKIIFCRPRPLYNPSMSPAVAADHYSFPSGHASRVFFVAALVSLSAEAMKSTLVELRVVKGSAVGGGYLDRWIMVGDVERLVVVVVVVVCVWAVMTASSRVLLGRHFVLDVVAGACIGVLEGLFAYRFLQLQDFLR